MSDAFTGGSALSNALVAAYDRYLEYALRSMPIFRQLVDKHPVAPTNPGATVTLSIVPELSALATTPLTETVDPDAVAASNWNRVTVTVNEYGNAINVTQRLEDLAFTPVDPALARIVGLNMIDTIDKLVQNVLDGATHVIGKNATVIKSENNSFAEGSVAAGDILDSTLILDATTLLRGRNAHGRDSADQFLAVIHPDVAADIMSNTGWLNPHNYVDTSNVYQAEIGSYLGARFVQSPRCTIVADGASSAKVYRTYVVGAQALVEAVVREPGIVVGEQVDKLRRFFPLGWKAHLGHAIYRQEAIQVIRSTSTIGAGSLHA